MPRLQLPVRIAHQPPEEPFILVDGQGPAALLELSHWPGNRTPPALRHELSTGCCLAFGRASAAEQERLAAGAELILNNHYDTDGVLAMFALRHPELALPRADAALGAASAGDFFRWPDDRSIAIDALVSALDRSPDSPLAQECAAMDAEARWNRCLEYLFGILPHLLDGELEPWRALWGPMVERARADRAELADLERRENAKLDLTTFAGLRGLGADLGRHALFGATEADRVLLLSRGCEGTRARLVVSTVSWFEPVRDGRLQRPDLARLQARLNELEGTTDADPVAWRAQPSESPSPELWFGTRDLSLFAEHNSACRGSQLSPARIRAEVEAALTPDREPGQ